MPQPTGNQLATVGFSRNFLSGSIQSTMSGSNMSLRTIILSSNYFVCQAKWEMGQGSVLGKGKFKDPTQLALNQIGLRLAQAYPNVQPFETTSVIEYHNVVLVWAGNTHLEASASYLPPQEPDVLRRADAIEQGQKGLFPGIIHSVMHFSFDWIVVQVRIN